MLQYADVLFPDVYTNPVWVLGIRLLPISLSHIIALDKIDSPFITRDFDDVSTSNALAMGHLFRAALICSMTHEEYLQWLQDPTQNEQILEYGKQLKAANPDCFNEHTGEMLPSELDKQYRVFDSYYQTGTADPDYSFEVNKDGVISGASPYQGMLLVATSKLGYTRQEAFNAPYQVVRFDALKYNEDNKGGRFQTERQVELEKAGMAQWPQKES